MGEVTAIEWTDHTFNPWFGCTKVSAACDNCYAEALMDTRWGKVTWGPGQPRVRTSAANWRQPIKWNRKAEGTGTRPRVFCASLADVFDAEVYPTWRSDLFKLIADTPNLDWLLLTKRPQVAKKWFESSPLPDNVWLGTTVEDQKMADLRIPILLSIPAKVRFLSCEPLLGPVDLRCVAPTDSGYINALSSSTGPNLDWIIVGGESGHGARPSHPDWLRTLRDQCAAAGVPFFFKQWGEHHPSADHAPETCPRKMWTPEAIHVSGEREMRPAEASSLIGYPAAPGWAGMCRVGKKVAGATLDGREWREFPA